MNLEKMAEKYRDTGFINRGGRIPAPIHSFKN